MTLEVHAEWDAEASVWIATSEDIPGLCVQADSFEDLVDIVTALTPDLLLENQVVTSAIIPLHIVAERTAIIRAA